MEEGFLIVLAFIVIVGIFWVVVLDIHKKFNVKNKKWRVAMPIITLFILLCLAFLNNNKVAKDREKAEREFRTSCIQECRERGNSIGYCDSCYLAAMDWRDAYGHSYVVSGLDGIIENIVGGLAITTANILDGVIGGAGYAIKAIKDSTSGVDIRIFSDIVMKMDLYYNWSILGCVYDFLDKRKATGKDVISRHGFSYCPYGIFSDSWIRFLVNIFVCLIFICLMIRIFSFNFKDSIFDIFRGKK